MEDDGDSAVFCCSLNFVRFDLLDSNAAYFSRRGASFMPTDGLSQNEPLVAPAFSRAIKMPVPPARSHELKGGFYNPVV